MSRRKSPALSQRIADLLATRPRAGNPPASLPAPPDTPVEGRTWYRIENHTDAPAEVWIYAEIGYWGVTAADFARDLSYVDAQQITVHVNSPGGEVWEGLAILTALRDHPAEITVKVDGIALSAASFVVQGGDRRIMARQSQMMIHDAIDFCFGNAADMRTEAELLDRVSDMIAEVYNDAAGGGVKTWRKTMQAEQWYSAQEAVDAGLADEVTPLPQREADDAAKVAASADLSVFRYAGREKAPAPAARAAQPDPEPAYTPPDPDQDVHAGTEALTWPVVDPATFRDRLTAATGIRYDPAAFVDFRDLLTAAAGDAPAVPSATPTPPPAAFPGSRRTAPAEPEPAPEQPMTLAEFVRAAVQVAADDAPAPPAPQHQPEPEPEPGPVIDSAAFTRALREARL